MKIDIRILTRPTTHIIHAHSKQCRDLKRQYGPGKKYGFSESEVFDAPSVQGVVEFVFCDILADTDSPWSDYRDEIKFYPCTSALKEEATK